MSFRLKTIIGIAVIETVLLLILIFTVLNFLKQTQSEELSKRIKIANQLLTTTAQDAMISSDLATLDSITAEFFKNPGIIYIRMLDKNNNVLSQAGEYTRDDNPAILDVNPDLIEDISIVHTQAVIKAYNVVFGRIETGYSVAHFSEFYDKARSQTLAIAITEIILVAIFSFFLGTYLTSQLGSLKKAAEQISHGDYLVNIRSKGNDEIAKTVSAFNQMAERLDKLWHQQKNSYRLIQSVQEIQFEFIKTTDKSEYFASLLKHILDLTQSEFGFIAEIQTNLTQQYLKTVALSNIAWNDTTRNLYNENRQEELEFYNLNTLFGQPVLTKQPLITNSPGTHQGASDLPAGHPP